MGQEKWKDKAGQKPEEKTKGSSKRTLIIVVCVLLIAVVAAGAAAVTVYLLNRKAEPEGYVITEENYLQIQEQMESEVNEGYFETYMNTEWSFQDGTSATEDAVLGNSPNNTKPIRCEVVLEDTQEVVLTTGVLPVGAVLPPFKLDVDLEAGKYEAYCIVYLLNQAEDGTYSDFSNAGFRVTLIVEN